MPPLLAPGGLSILATGEGGAGSAQPLPVAQAAPRNAAQHRAAQAAGPWAPRAGSVMLAVSLKWRLGVVRRRPKGMGPRGLGLDPGLDGGRWPRGLGESRLPLPALLPLAPPRPYLPACRWVLGLCP